jgi:hypothetical protein
VLGYFGNLPGRIKTALGDLGTLLYNAGRAILQGLINGMESMVRSVENIVKGLGNDIRNWFRDVTGISSPSAVFHEMGTQIVQGLVNGINDNARLAHGAIANLTAGATRGLSGNLSLGVSGGVGAVAASPSAGGGTTILQVTTPIQINGQTIAQTVTQYQLRQARATGTIHGQYAGGSQTGLATGINPNAISR